jgi:putative membrane protein
MVETEFVVRCSGRIQYAKAIIVGAILTYAAMRAHNWVEFPVMTAYEAIWGLAIFYIIISFVRAKIQYIDIDSEGITMHTGLVNKKTRYVPYERIDNIKVDRNIIERIFFLGSLGVDTAGSNQVEIQMRDIPSHYLDRMISSVQKRVSEARGRAPPSTGGRR